MKKKQMMSVWLAATLALNGAAPTVVSAFNSEGLYEVTYSSFEEAFAAVAEAELAAAEEDEEEPEKYRFGLVYLDGDQIPELIITDNYGSMDAYYYKNGMVSELYIGDIRKEETDDVVYETNYRYIPYANEIWYTTSEVDNNSHEEDIDVTLYTLNIGEDGIRQEFKTEYYKNSSTANTWMSTADDSYVDLGATSYVEAEMLEVDGSYDDLVEKELPAAMEKFVAAGGNTALPTADAGEEDPFAKLAADDSLSEEEQYQQAYELEMNQLGDVVAAYYQSQSEYKPYFSEEDILENAKNLEETYQAVDDADPNIKTMIAADAGASFGGNSFLGNYLVQQGTMGLLGDSETASEIRTAAFALPFVLVDLIQLIPEDPECSVECLEPVKVTDESVLVKTRGSINEILDMNRKNIVMIDDAIDDRIANLKELATQLEAGSGSANVNQAQQDALLQEKDNNKTAFDALMKDILNGFDITENSEEMNDPVYFLLDAEGNVLNSFVGAVDDVSIDNAGDVAIEVSVDYEDKRVILGADGTERFRGNAVKEAVVGWDTDSANEEGYYYYRLTEAGTVLRFHKETSFNNGDYYVAELMSMDGTVLDSIEVGELRVDEEYSDNENYWEFEYREPGSSDSYYYILDMATGEHLTEDEFEELNAQDVVYPDGVNANSCEILNDNYYVCYDDDQIYSVDGKVAANVSGGQGVRSILYNGNAYLIVSRSGYYYALDTDFKQIGKEMKMPETDSGNLRSWMLTPSGLFVDGETPEDWDVPAVMELYDETCTLSMTFEYMTVSDLRSQMDDWYGYEVTPSGTDFFFCGGSAIGWYNMQTRSLMKIAAIPENAVAVKW